MTKNNDECNYLFKVIFIGNSSVGKTSVVYRFSDGSFRDDIPSTIGVDFFVKQVNIDNKSVKLQIWDTAGQEKYNNIISNYYRGANVVFVVFSVVDEKSMLSIPNWILKYKIKNKTSDAEIVLLGNKIDIIEDEEKDFKDSIKKKIAKIVKQDYKLYFVSAKSGINIHKVFEDISKSCIERYNSNSLQVSKKKKRIHLDEEIDSSFCC